MRSERATEVIYLCMRKCKIYLFHPHASPLWNFTPSYHTFLQLLCNYLLPCGNKPLDFALFLAAFHETRFLIAGFWQAYTQTFWQCVRLDTRFGGCTQYCPLPQAVATLTRTLPNKQKHDLNDILSLNTLSYIFLNPQSSHHYFCEPNHVGLVPKLKQTSQLIVKSFRFLCLNITSPYC